MNQEWKRCGALLVVAALSLAVVTKLFPQDSWTVDWKGNVAADAQPLPTWESGRAYLIDRGEALLQVRQSRPQLRLDYNLAAFVRHTSEQESYGDLTQLNAELTLREFPGALGLFHIALGRLPIADLSGYVFDQPGDGVALAMRVPGFEMAATAGYLGLLLKNTNQVRLTPADEAAIADPNVVLAPSGRLVALVTLSLPDLAFRTDLGFSGLYLASDLGRSSIYDRWYGELFVRGPLWGPIAQRSTLVVGAQLGSRISLLAALAAIADFPEVLGSHAEIEGLYASGATNSMSAFLPLTGNDPTNLAGVILAVPYQNLGLVRATYSFRPFSKSTSTWLVGLAPFVSTRWYFRPADLPVPSIGYDPSGSFYGTELEGGFAFRHGVDPSLSLSGGLFVDASWGTQWFARSSLTVSF